MKACTILSWLQAPVIAGLIATSLPVLAQDVQTSSPGVSESERAAKRAHREGVREYAEGRYTEAIQHFQEADHLQPSAALSYNVARAYQALGDDREAVRWYRDYLLRAGQPHDARRVQRRIERLEPKLRADAPQEVPVAPASIGEAVVTESAALDFTPLTAPSATYPYSNVALRQSGVDDVSKDSPQAPGTSQETPTAQPSEHVRESVELMPSELAPPVVESDRPKRRPPPGQKQPRATRPGTSGTKVLGIVATATGLATLGSALTVELVRRSTEAKARRETLQVQYALDLNLMQSQLLAERLLAGIGAGLTLTGVALVLLAPGSTVDESNRGFSLNCTGTGCGVSVRGRY